MSFLGGLFNGARGQQKELEGAEKVLAAARQQAAEIISGATEQADRILSETKLFTKGIHKDLERTLDTTAVRTSEQADAHLKQIIRVFEQQLTTVTDRLEQAAKAELGALREQMGEQLSAAADELTAETEEGRQGLKRDLEDVKRRRIHQLGAQLNKQLPHIVKEAAGRSIPLSEHEQLVRDALQRAKDENLW